MVSGPKQAEPRERERGKLGCAGCCGLGPSAGEWAAGRGEKGVGRRGLLGPRERKGGRAGLLVLGWEKGERAMGRFELV